MNAVTNRSEYTVNFTDDESKKLLFSQIKNKQTESLEKYLSPLNINLDFHGHCGMTPLTLACLNDKKGEIVQLLIDKNANVNFLDKNEMSPMFAAVLYSNLVAVKILLTNNAEILRRCMGNTCSARELAFNMNNIEIMNIFLEKTEVSQGVKNRWLLNTSSNKLVKVLIAHKADVNAEDEKSDTPLDKAAQQGNVDLVNRLIKAGAKVDGKDCFNPLYHAMINKHFTVVSALLDANANPNIRFPFRFTPLHAAAMQQNVPIETLPLLIFHGADSRNTSDGTSPSDWRLTWSKTKRKILKNLSNATA